MAIWASSHKFVGLYICSQLRHVSTIGKNLLSSNMSPQYGELRPTSGSDRSGCLRHPCKFQWVSRLGSVTASSSGRQPNFAALNRGCHSHLCSAGRPSRWALAHILVSSFHFHVVYVNLIEVFKITHFNGFCYHRYHWILFWAAICKTVRRTPSDRCPYV